MRSWVLKLYFNCRSLTTSQNLSFIICFSCIIYLILSNFSYISVKNITSPTWVQSISDQIISKQDINYKSRTKNSSFICDRIRKPAEVRETNLSSSIHAHIINNLYPYCEIVPTPRQKWTSAKRYTESDIVFIIYTGAAFYHNRATSVRNTWLSRVTHKYFFSATPYPSLPITVIEGAGEDYLSNIKKLSYGMQIAYREHNQTAKFYFLAGCDTFVNVPHLLKRLEKFDYQEPLIIGGYAYTHKCYIKRNETKDKIFYPSGGAGFFLSSPIMKLMQPKLNPYFENDWPLTQDKAFTDVAINCLAYSMGFKPSFVPGFWAFNPELTLRDSGRKQLHADSEPNTFHYVDPSPMYVLDEFYIHQLLDRLGNDQNFDELMKFTRQFVLAHYHLLRITRQECTLPPIPTTQKR